MMNLQSSVLGVVLLLSSTVAAQVVGDTITLGYTWYDSNNEAPRRLVKDNDDYLQFCWKEWTNISPPYYIKYNFMNPAGYLGSGYVVEGSVPAGFPGIDIDDEGRAFISYYRKHFSLDRWNAAVAFDFIPRSGAFLTYEPDWVGNLELCDPRFQFDRDEIIRLIATEMESDPGHPYANFILRAFMIR
jgi:hypothetical protein